MTALHKLVTHCGCGALDDELVRGRLEVGLQDVKLSESSQFSGTHPRDGGTGSKTEGSCTKTANRSASRKPSGGAACQHPEEQH